jgi:hypothetical protein
VLLQQRSHSCRIRPLQLQDAVRAHSTAIIVLQVNDRMMRAVAENNNYAHGDSLFRAPNGGVISNPEAGNRTALLYSSDLQRIYRLSKSALDTHLISASGKTFGQQLEPNRWEIYKTSDSPEPIRDGRRGELLALSDRVLVYRQHRTIRVEEINETHLGSFPSEPPSKCVTAVQVIGTNHIWATLATRKSYGTSTAKLRGE